MNETQLFWRLKDAYFPDIEATTAWGTYDCLSHSRKILIELKCRRRHYEELIIEREKYEKLLLLSALRKYRALYICSTPKGTYSWNLNELTEPDWFYVELPAVTDFEGEEKRVKEVGYLKISLAIKLEFNLENEL